MAGLKHGRCGRAVGADMWSVPNAGHSLGGSLCRFARWAGSWAPACPRGGPFSSGAWTVRPSIGAVRA